jgi:hypothetical protein
MSRLIERARALIERPGAWLDQSSVSAYPLRLGHDRRSRVLLTLDEASFRALVEQPGLKLRQGGGWQARPNTHDAANDGTPVAGRPGMIDGQRVVIQRDGQLTALKANLGESPILWLARRKDASGRPWLTPCEIAAGERLRSEAEQALSGASLTMRWDSLPQGRGGSPRAMEPSERRLNAAQRVRQALDACSPRLRPMLEQVCIHGSSLQLAEQGLALRRRQGKTVLKQGLQALAEYYGMA